MSSPQSTTATLKAGRMTDLWIFKALVQEHLDLNLGVGLQSSGFKKDSEQWHKAWRREKQWAGQLWPTTKNTDSSDNDGDTVTMINSPPVWTLLPHPFSLCLNKNQSKLKKKKHSNSWGLLKETNNKILWSHTKIPNYNNMKTARLIEEMENETIRKTRGLGKVMWITGKQFLGFPFKK